MIAITNVDSTTAASMLTLAGGVLSFAAVILAVIHGRLDKARNVAQRDRIVGKSFDAIAFILAVSGLIIFVMFDAHTIALWLFLLSFIVTTISFLRIPSPPNRLEIVLFVLFSCGVSVAFLMDFISRIVLILEKLVDTHK